MIYIAGPYYHTDPDVIEYRMTLVYAAMSMLIEQGFHPVSPMLMHEVVTRYQLPNDFEFWGTYSLNMLKHCSKMIVITSDGWSKSRGVTEEIKFATENNIPIEYIDEGYVLGYNNLSY